MKVNNNANKMELIKVEDLRNTISKLDTLYKDGYKVVYFDDLIQEIKDIPIIVSGTSKKDIFISTMLAFLDEKIGYAELDAYPDAANAFREVKEYINSISKEAN